jgi:hypothetical protein
MDQPPDWAVDMVVTEIRREYPAEVTKQQLQEKCGIGAGDLRDVLTYLVESHRVLVGDDGWLWNEEGVTSPAPEVAPEPDVRGVTPEEELEAAQENAEVVVGDTRYTTVVAIEVQFYPELVEGDAGEDDAAIRDARGLAEIAAGAVAAAHPDLPVNARVVRLEAYDKPRGVPVP